jgi:hexulose-6-phosphate isomerase
MKTGISYWSFDGGLSGELPAGKAAAIAKSAGFEVIELCIAESGVLSVNSSEADCKKMRSDVESAGVGLESLASGMTWGCSPTHPDASVRRRAIELHEAALQRAAWLGCSSMLCVPGAIHIPWDPSYPWVQYDKAVQWAREGVAALAKTAERVKVELCVENVWNGLFYSPLEFRDFVDSFHSPWVGAYFDVGNCMGQHQYPPHWIELLGSRIKRIHIKDFKRSVGNLDGFVDLLEGDQPWAETMKALKAIGYNRTLVAEMIPFAPGRVEKTGKAMQQIVRM